MDPTCPSLALSRAQASVPSHKMNDLHNYSTTMKSMAALRSLRLLRPPLRYLRSHSTLSIACGAGDPAIHSETPQGEEAEEAAKLTAARKLHKSNRPKSLPITPPFASAPRLEATEVVPPTDPMFQQKRHSSTSETNHPFLNDFACVGWDGAPLDGSDEMIDWGENKQEENKEYFEGRKATPLSGIVLADTRKPIERAWDHATTEVDEEGCDLAGGFVEDSVDAALKRAEMLFQAAKEKWDPETPWGRVLLKGRADV